jgi:hypothetical protein
MKATKATKAALDAEYDAAMIRAAARPNVRLSLGIPAEPS